MSSILKIGDILPDLTFEAYDPNDKSFKTIILGEILKQGKWIILFFYPADFSIICPTELKDLGDKYDDFVKLGVEIFSISTNTKYTHLAWHESEPLLKNIKFKMGVDTNGEISKLLGIYNELNGLSRRGTFIINPEGRLVGIEVVYDNIGRNANELLRKMQTYVYLYRYPKEAYLFKWNNDKQNLSQSEELIGRLGKFLNSSLNP